jgi:hypothetical protein
MRSFIICTPHPILCGDKVENEMGGPCSAEWGWKRSVQGFGAKPEGKRPLGRPSRRWEDNIKMDVQEVECGVCTGFSWISTETGCECGNESSGSIKCGKFIDSANRLASQEGLCSMV